MATKKQSSGKQSSSASAETEAAETALHVELIGIDPGAPEGDMAVEALVNTGTGKIVDFTVLESRVAQAEQGYASAVASVGTTADELRDARAALREARGG